MPALPASPIRIAIRSTASHLPVVRAALEAAAGLVGFDDRCRHHVVLAVDEALANVIEHAYDGREDGEIEMTLTPIGDDGRAMGLEVLLRDHGQAVEPAAIRGRPLDDLRPGGLGVHIINSCMDIVEYSPVEGGGSRMRMVKLLPGHAPAAKQTSVGPEDANGDA